MDVADIIDAIDPIEYLSQYTDLQQRGNEFWGLSPFKDERTPSFSVDPGKKFFYDFSSGLGGNLIDFVMKYHHVDVHHAVEMLKQFAGITDDTDSPIVRLSATGVAKKYRHSEKKKKNQPLRSLSQSQMERYVVDLDKLSLWVDEGIPVDVLRRFDVRYDPLDNRIVYPIRDYDGNLISICGRTCDPDYKEKKIRKYTYYQSLGSLNTLYGLSDLREEIISARELILFEGAKSVMKAYGWGRKNACAALTSHVSDAQLGFLIPFCCRHGVNITIAFDADVDVLGDANIRRLSQFADVRWVKNIGNLLGEKDSPVDRGQEIFDSLYERRVSVH